MIKPVADLGLVIWYINSYFKLSPGSSLPLFTIEKKLSATLFPVPATGQHKDPPTQRGFAESFQVIYSQLSSIRQSLH